MLKLLCIFACSKQYLIPKCMNKRINVKWFFGMLLLFAPIFLQAQSMEKLPLDPNVRYGKLKNGMTYYIRHNDLPKERADFYIVQNVGSILEEENQRGLAHFLEHMAFNGTKNFDGMGIKEYAESLGMRFGENLNAYTGFDETVYMLMNAPVTRSKGVVDSCLLVLHDWSNSLLLKEDEIDKERGVIREEWRTGQDAQARLWEQQLPKMYPDSRYANRLPIGLIDVINNFKPEELRAYYHKWYRPDLQAVLIVGDVDVDEVEKTLQAEFADIPTPENPAKREFFPVPDNDEPLVSIATDKEASSTMLYIYYKHDKLPEEMKGTAIEMVQDYIQGVAAMMLNTRFEEMVQKPDPPFIYAGASDGDYMIAKTKAAWMVAAVTKPEEIERSMNALVSETERVKQFGFTTSEYDRARMDVLKQMESAYNERNKQENRKYIRECLNHFTNGGYMPGIEVEYNMMQQIAPMIAVDQVNQYVQSVLSDKNIVISLLGTQSDDIKYPTEPELLDMFKAAHNIKVEAYEDNVSNEPLIPTLPKAGKIVSEKVDPKFGATVMTLSNGAKVIVKHTDFKKDEIRMSAASPGGTTLLDPSDYTNVKVLNEVVGLGGYGNFSVVDLNKALAGKKVSCSSRIGSDGESMGGSATPADLKTLFELIYLSFTSQRQDDDAYQSYVTRSIAQLKTMDLYPMVALSDTLTKSLYGNSDPRVTRLKEKDFDVISYPRILEIYKERFADASDFQFTFVGNIDMDSIRPLIEQYIASLPSINRKEKGDADKVPQMIQGKQVNHFSKTMETPKASVVDIYFGKMDYTQENRLSATILKQILDLVYTEEVREKEGGTYGVQTGASISYFPKGQTMLQVMFDTDPEKREHLAKIVKDELTKIAENGPRTEDLVKTRDNMKKRFDEQIQQNGYWLSALEVYYYRDIDDYSNYLSTLEKITPETIQKFAKKLLQQGNVVEVVMEP